MSLAPQVGWSLRKTMQSQCDGRGSRDINHPSDQALTGDCEEIPDKAGIDALVVRLRRCTCRSRSWPGARHHVMCESCGGVDRGGKDRSGATRARRGMMARTTPPSGFWYW
jgi:hypothetical protein